MKFSATILALCLVQTSAFVAPQAPKASLLPLTASPNGEVSQRTGTIPESRTVRLSVVVVFKVESFSAHPTVSHITPLFRPL